MSVCIIEDYLEPVIDESGSGQMVLKKGKTLNTDKDIKLTPASGIVGTSWFVITLGSWHFHKSFLHHPYYDVLISIFPNVSIISK